jgi:hypothetical protein
MTYPTGVLELGFGDRSFFGWRWLLDVNGWWFMVIAFFQLGDQWNNFLNF